MVSGRRSHAAALWHSGSAMPGHPRSFRAALSGDTRASRPSRNAALRSRRSLSQALGPCHRLPACLTRNVRRFPPISARRRKSTPRNTHSIAYSPRNCKREWRRGKTRKNDRIRISSQNRRKTSRKGIRRKGPSPYISKGSSPYISQFLQEQDRDVAQQLAPEAEERAGARQRRQVGRKLSDTHKWMHWDDGEKEDIFPLALC